MKTLFLILAFFLITLSMIAAVPDFVQSKDPTQLKAALSLPDTPDWNRGVYLLGIAKLESPATVDTWPKVEAFAKTNNIPSGAIFWHIRYFQRAELAKEAIAAAKLEEGVNYAHTLATFINNKTVFLPAEAYAEAAECLSDKAKVDPWAATQLLDALTRHSRTQSEAQLKSDLMFLYDIYSPLRADEKTRPLWEPVVNRLYIMARNAGGNPAK